MGHTVAAVRALQSGLSATAGGKGGLAWSGNPPPIPTRYNVLSQAELNAQINAAMETEDYDLCDKLNAQVEELSASKRNAEDILGGGGGGGGGSDDLDAILSSGGSGAAVATGPSSERVPPCPRLRGRPPAGFDSIRLDSIRCRFPSTCPCVACFRAVGAH